jgi:hypothetical protein
LLDHKVSDYHYIWSRRRKPIAELTRRELVGVVVAILLALAICFAISRSFIPVSEFSSALAYVLIASILGVLAWGFKPRISRWLGISKPPGKEDLLTMGKAEAERKHELDVKESQRAVHHQNLLKVYRKWAQYHISYPDGCNYGSTYFRLLVGGLPDKDDYYQEARTDLECYPKTRKILLEAEVLAQKADNKGDLVVRNMKQEVKQFMEKFNLKEWNEGGLEAGRWYYYHTIIPLLIVEPVDKGNEYHKPKIELVGDVIRAPEEGRDLCGKFQQEDSVGIIQGLYGLTTELVPKLSHKIQDLQEDLKRAEQAYSAFKNNLLQDVIKPLETGFSIPTGGRCSICSSLRT